MRCRSLLFVLALAVMLAVPAFADRPANGDAEIGAVLRLVGAGVSDEVIIKHIRAAGYVFDLTTDDIVDLRHQGVSDTVLEAMLDTAIDNDNAPQSTADRAPDADSDDVDHATTTVALSAGWFSPWYQYPYAWGSYYDPFPVWYSYYYYPFSFCGSWGYYGHNHGYYYCNGWAGYRWWDNVGWYNQCRTRPGCRIPVYRTDRLTWQAGRALPANHGIGRVRTHNPTEVSRPRRERWSSAPRLDERFDRSRLQVRQPGGSSEAIGAPRRRAPESVRVPRSYIPESAPAPRASPPPQRSSSGHDSAPASSPRGSMASPPSTAPPSAPPAAGRSGGATMAPRGESGGRSRLRP